MKILWLTPIFPYPPFSGGQTRVYNLLKNLAKRHEITLFSFWRPNRIQGPMKKVEKICLKVKVFPGRPIWSARDIFLAGATGLPFAVTHFYGDKKMEKAISEELNEGYDLIHFESFYTIPYLRTDFGVPTVLGNENIEYLIYHRFVQQKKNALFKWLAGYDVWKMKRYEEAGWRRADLNLAVSEPDAEQIEKVTKKKCAVIPNGVDIKHFEQFEQLKYKNMESKLALLFVGDFKYFTNQDAIAFLVRKIWPRIKAKIEKVSLKLVGRNANSLINDLAVDGVQIVSDIDDIRQAYAAADVFLAPMRIASGTNIKILEAMAAGLPVVTTSVGAEGIKAKRGKEIIVRDKADELAEKVIELAHKPLLRQSLGLAGKRVIRRFYDWQKIVQELEKVYRGLIDEKKN